MSNSIQERLKRLEYQYKCLCNTPSGQGPQGPPGPQGIQGSPGFGIDFQGQLADPSLLPQPSTQGFAYLIGNDFWIYDGSGNWVNAGPIQGPQGIPGIQGIQGVPGDPGATGPQGQGFTYQGNWDNGTTYFPYDVVTYQGSTYITPNTNASSVPSYDNLNSDWYLFTSIGQQGPQGDPGSGGGGSSCPDHIKLAAVSGRFVTNNFNAPDIGKMYSGNPELGWSFGNYEFETPVDGFGNLLFLKSSDIKFGITLPVDLNVGDTIKISGIITIEDVIDGDINQPKFYVTVSSFSCSSARKKIIDLNTVIPVAEYVIDKESGTTCFSESITLSSILPADETFFVVGLTAGNNKDLFSPTMAIGFSYTLDATQACIGTGKNLLIRNCCDPAYSEIIIDNGVEIGKSFSDTDGNCWTVETVTEDAVTGVRDIKANYFDCQTCINSHPCPENFIIKACCGEIIGEVFSAALVGVNVGDTFVDTNGYCWFAEDTTPLPITNVIEVDTVYPETSCQSAVCVDNNPCPTPVNLFSCCGSLRGSTTLEILQAAIPTLNFNDGFVDQFGMCWEIIEGGYAFPNLSFITPVTEYSAGGAAPCTTCSIDNECPGAFYYTIQNCCTEEIEVVKLQPAYNISEVLTLELDIAFGCYEILSWSNTGTETATVQNVVATLDNCEQCREFVSGTFGGYYCSGVEQCCVTYQANLAVVAGSARTISGYKCDGTFILDYVLQPEETICMAFVFGARNVRNTHQCCEYDVFNPSLINSITVVYETCAGQIGEAEIPANTLLSSVIAKCVGCVRTTKPGQEFEYRDCTL